MYNYLIVIFQLSDILKYNNLHSVLSLVTIRFSKNKTNRKNLFKLNYNLTAI